MHKSLFQIFVMVIAVVSVFFISVLLFSCSYTPGTFTSADVAGSTREGIKQVIDASNQFAFDYCSELNQRQQENVLFSPYGIFAAFALAYEGAKGKTADEMKGVFHFPQSSLLRPNFAAIYNEIYKGFKAYELTVGNALWVQEDYPLLEDYMNTVENYYRGNATNLDFEKSASFGFIGTKSGGPIFIADHPFIFIIQQKQTGIILFLGRVVDPRS